MLFAALVSHALLCLSALALPSSRDRLAQRMARRGHGGVVLGGARRSLPLANATRAAGACTGACDVPDDTFDSTNWSGAVLSEAAVRTVLSPSRAAAANGV